MTPVTICFVISLKTRTKKFQQKSFEQKAVTTTMLAARATFNMLPRGLRCVLMSDTKRDLDQSRAGILS